MSGLENLRSIGGSMIVKGQYSLASFSGLDSLQSIDLTFEFSDNYSNTSFAGLGAETIGGINVYSNPSLDSIQGLDRLKSTANIEITYNNSLVSISGFNALATIEGNLWLENGPISISGFNALATIEGNLYILVYNLGGPGSITGFQNLQTVLGYFEVDGNFKILSGFAELDTIYGPLGIGHTALNDMSGFEQLTYVSGMFIKDNPALVDLSGLHNLKSLGYSLLKIENNDGLTSLDGLDGLDHTTMTDLSISGNDSLSFCHIEPICKYLQSGGTALIANAPGCYSLVQVKSKCQTLPTEDLITEEIPLQISPNPAADFLQIQISDLENWDISLFDLQGRQMFRQRVSGNQIIEVKDWPAGVYALRAVSGRRVISRRFVKR